MAAVSAFSASRVNLKACKGECVVLAVSSCLLDIETCVVIVVWGVMKISVVSGANCRLLCMMS